MFEKLDANEWSILCGKQIQDTVSCAQIENALDNNCVKHENTQSTTCMLYANLSMNKLSLVHELKDAVMVKFYVSISLSHRVLRFWSNVVLSVSMGLFF